MRLLLIIIAGALLTGCSGFQFRQTDEATGGTDFEFGAPCLPKPAPTTPPEE